jgi:TRAP-type C4-dicarboxylate transport system substrate-binding protein
MAVVMVAAMAVAGWPAAGAATTWKAAISGQSRTSSQPFEWYAKEVAAKTGGQLKIELVYTGADRGSSVELLKSGAAEAGYLCAGYFADKMPLTTVMELPMFAPSSVAVLGRVDLALADHPAIQAELRRWNVKMLLPVPLPQQQLMGTRRIAKIEDFRGAKVRIGPEMGKILEEYGATISHVSANDSSAAFKSGAVEIWSTSYPVTFYTNKIYESSKYVTDNISLGGQLCYFGVSQKAWDALPARTREVMLALRQPAMARYEEIYAREDASYIAAFKEKGLEFVPFSPSDRARLIAKAIKYWQLWIDEREKQGLKGREVFEFVQTKIREYSRK